MAWPLAITAGNVLQQQRISPYFQQDCRKRRDFQGAGKPCHSNLVHSLKKLLDLNALCGGRMDQVAAKHLKTADSVRTSLGELPFLSQSFEEPPFNAFWNFTAE